MVPFCPVTQARRILKRSRFGVSRQSLPDVGGIACSGAGSLQAPQPQGVYEGLQVGDLQVGLGLRRRGRAEAPLVARFPSSFGVVAFLYPRRIPRKAGGSKP